MKPLAAWAKRAMWATAIVSAMWATSATPAESPATAPAAQPTTNPRIGLERRIPFKCTKCSHVEYCTVRQLRKMHEGLPMGPMEPPKVDCSQCGGQKTAVQAIECPDCTTVFVISMDPAKGIYDDRCPKCGASYAEAWTRALKKDRPLSRLCPASTTQPATAIRVGVYDSRQVAAAYTATLAHEQLLSDMTKEIEHAQAAGDTKRADDLRACKAALRTKRLLQGFSGVSVQDILETVKKDLPDVARRAGVEMIVSRWQVDYQTPGTEVVDVTAAIVALFHPDEKVQRTLSRLEQCTLVPIESLLKSGSDRPCGPGPMMPEASRRPKIDLNRQIPFLCTQCGHVERITVRELREKNKNMPMGPMEPPKVDCSQCGGKKTAVQAIECPECRNVFVISMDPMKGVYDDRCPKCGASYAVAWKKHFGKCSSATTSSPTTPEQKK